MKTKKRRGGSRGRIPRTAEERQELIESFNSSGQSQADFCRERGINATTFNGWLRGRVGGGKARVRKPKVKFARVDVPVNTRPEVEIALPGGVRVLIRNGGSVGQVAELIREVTAKCSASPDR